MGIDYRYIGNIGKNVSKCCKFKLGELTTTATSIWLPLLSSSIFLLITAERRLHFISGNRIVTQFQENKSSIVTLVKPCNRTLISTSLIRCNRRCANTPDYFVGYITDFHRSVASILPTQSRTNSVKSSLPRLLRYR